MTVARVTEITSTSKKGFQDAVEKGVARAGKTLKNITGAWVEDHKVTCDNGKITKYMVRLKVTFILND